MLLALAAGFAPLAQAAAAPGGLAQCLIRSTTPAGQKTVVRWAFATMALDPDVASLAAITASQRKTINRRAGALVTKLLVKSCSQPLRQALLAGGPSAIEAAFDQWGSWALTGIAGDPHVQQGMGTLLEYISLTKLMSVLTFGGPAPGSGGPH